MRTISKSARRLLVSVLVFLAAAEPAVAAPPSASLPPPPAPLSAAMTPAAIRYGALSNLAARLKLPLVDEAVAIFSRQLRRTVPSTLVVAIGQLANLGTEWRPGNPTYDQTLQHIDRAIGNEEARGGPLLRLDRRDLLYVVDVPWSMDDIAFIDAMLDTDIGRDAERALDAKAAQQIVATLRRRIATGAGGQGIAPAFADLDARAQAQFGDAALMLLAANATDPRVKRLQRLMETVTIAPSDAFGQRIVDRLSQRLLDAAKAQLPELGSIAGFR